MWHSMLLFLNFLYYVYCIMHPFVTAPSSSLPLRLLGWFYAYLLMYSISLFPTTYLRYS